MEPIYYIGLVSSKTAQMWLHNDHIEHENILNHKQLNYLFNSLFALTKSLAN